MFLRSLGGSAMPNAKRAIPFVASLLSMILLNGLGGCGLGVPEIQEFPNESVEGQKFVFAIIKNITCEVQDAINYVYVQDAIVDPTLSNVAFLNSWGVQLELSLTIDEKGSLGPTVNWTPPSPVTAVFNLAGAATLSSDASRIDKIYSYYTVPQLRKLGKCSDRQDGPFLLENDLKLKEWLLDTVMAGGSGEVQLPTNANGPFKSDVISHEVKFDILSSGSATPGWKFKLVAVNQNGTLLALSRERTHDLIITLGPNATVAGKNAPSVRAQNAALASDISVGVTNGIRNALQP